MTLLVQPKKYAKNLGVMPSDGKISEIQKLSLSFLDYKFSVSKSKTLGLQ